MNLLARRACAALTLAAAASLAGCFTYGNEKQPIEMLFVPAPKEGAPAAAVVVLPGMGTDAADMRAHEIDRAIQRAWPGADVLLTSATFAYYTHGVLVPRLESEVMGPARSRYKTVYLAGASMGGMGALLYERMHPGEAAGLLLFAPFLGKAELLDEIRAAGGVRSWDPGPKPDQINGDNWQREVWRTIKDWSQDPAKAQRVWIVCGKDDRLIEAARLAATALPPSHFIEVDGGHDWKTWSASAEQVLPQVRNPL